MIHRSLLALSSTVLVAMLATPVSEVFARPVPPSVVTDQDETQLAKYMEEVNKGFRRLRSDLKNPQKNEASLALVRRIGELCGKSRLEKPDMLKDIKEADRAQFVVDFQVALLEMHAKLLELERALIEGDNDLAAQLRDEINKSKSDAHKKFKADEDKAEEGEEGGAGAGGEGRRRR